MIRHLISNPKRFIVRALALAMFLFLFGCTEELYTNLPEKEINEMMAILINHGIACEKSPAAENMWNISVNRKHFAKAMKILMNNGFPRQNYASIGEVFKKSGLISSPSEERIRFIHALSQEVSETISNIDGVISARVHVVMPENNPFDEQFLPSSASVFIKHKPNTDVDQQVLKIKELVVNSIEGLEFKNVTVAMFPSRPDIYVAEASPLINYFGLKLTTDSAPALRRMIALVLAFIAGTIIAVLYFYLKHNKGGLKAMRLNELVKYKGDDRADNDTQTSEQNGVEQQ